MRQLNNKKIKFKLMTVPSIDSSIDSFIKAFVVFVVLANPVDLLGARECAHDCL